ncbi:MAG: hypothetical protein ACTSUI_08240, partial [Promethearchaeota archaeon]
QQDEKYSDFFCVPQSIKITTVKPSGTVSLLPGVSPGIHYPHAEYYIRRIRIAKQSSLIDLLKEANYPVEQDAYSDNSMVVEFPVHEVNFLRSKKDASLWEQFANTIDYQHYWSDNQVSITVTFKPEEVKDLPYALEFVEDKIKGVSLLPLTDSGYKQMPYEEITAEDFKRRSDVLKPLKNWTTAEKSVGTIYCDGDSCSVVEDANVLKQMEDLLGESIPSVQEINADSFGFRVINGQICDIGLANKHLENLPDEVGLLENLEQLTLKNTGLEILPATLLQLKKLHYLNLEGCPLSQLNDDMISWLKRFSDEGKQIIR